jgi:hypothetical protein
MSRQDEIDMDGLAELVADGKTIRSAGIKLRLSALRCAWLWERIVARRGAQAA